MVLNGLLLSKLYLSLKKLPLRQRAEWILRDVLNMAQIRKIPTASGKK
jgi:hypothetical protein